MWPLELGLGTHNPRFVVWPLELGLRTHNLSMRDKMVWRKSRAMSPADWELFLMLPPDRDVALEEALELLREEDIVKRAGTETKCRRNKQLMPHRM